MSFSAAWKITATASNRQRVPKTYRYDKLPSAKRQYDLPNYCSRSGLHNVPKELPKNYRAAKEEEHLRRVRPSKDFLVHPDEPFPVASETDLQMDEIVWHRHTDRTWYLTCALCFVPSHKVPMVARVLAEGHLVWQGLTRGLDSRNTYRKHGVHLIPGAGNAKPYNWYTRLPSLALLEPDPAG